MIDDAVFDSRDSGDNGDVVYAICQIQYWQSTLWFALWELLAKVEAGSMDMESVRNYRTGLILGKTYGVGNDAQVCVLDENLEWRIKTLDDMELGRRVGVGAIRDE